MRSGYEIKSHQDGRRKFLILKNETIEARSSLFLRSIQRPKPKQLLSRSQAQYNHHFQSTMCRWHLRCNFTCFHKPMKSKSATSHVVTLKTGSDINQNQYHTWFHLSTWFSGYTTTNTLLIYNCRVIILQSHWNFLNPPKTKPKNSRDCHLKTALIWFCASCLLIGENNEFQLSCCRNKSDGRLTNQNSKQSNKSIFGDLGAVSHDRTKKSWVKIGTSYW